MRTLYLVSIILSLTACNFNRNANPGSDISSLPDFRLQLIDSTTIVGSKAIKTGNPILLMYFRPDCEHCQLETKNIIKNISAIKNTSIYLITAEPLEDLRQYHHDFNLQNYQNITVAKDYEYSFLKIFKPRRVPYIAIYDGKKKLVRLFMGETDFNKILTLIQS